MFWKRAPMFPFGKAGNHHLRVTEIASARASLLHGYRELAIAWEQLWNKHCRMPCKIVMYDIGKC
jgi:hypothetical protein